MHEYDANLHFYFYTTKRFSNNLANATVLYHIVNAHSRKAPLRALDGAVDIAWGKIGGTRGQISVKHSAARHRKMANNLYKIMSAKSRQIEWKNGLEARGKPIGFLLRALCACKRATVGNRKGHSRSTTVALLQARLGLFRPVFGPENVSIKIKPLIVSVLKPSPKSPVCARADCRW